MRRIKCSDAQPEDTVGIDMYDEKGRQLLKKGAKTGVKALSKLRQNGINHIYIEDQDIFVSGVFNTGITAELLKVLWHFRASGGKNSEITKKYSLDEIKKISGYSNETGSKIAFGHVFRYFIGKMAACVKRDSYYDFSDYRSVSSYLPFHAVGAVCVSLLTGYEMGMKERELTDLGVGALLYDLKMDLYAFAARESGIDDIEKQEMMEHAYLSYDSIRKIYGISAASAAAAYQHHERVDGSGYPKKLKGDGINIYAKIISVADVYDALLSSRPFRPAYRPEEAWDYIVSNSGLLFDETVVSSFIKRIAKYRPGSSVLLSDGREGIVTRNSPGEMEHPYIKIIEKKDKNAIITREELKINAESGVSILKTIM